MKKRERNQGHPPLFPPGAQADARSPGKQPSRKRVLLFKLISILIPFLLLFLLEISLRVFHYGNDLSLFIEYPADNNFLVMNPAASQKYFTHQANATTGNIEPFRKEKEENTLRIFVLGESTTIGYPYFHNGSFHRWLQYRLMHEFPDKNFEIINLSLTAVNSYTVLGFARELVDYSPDAILIYSGHNEYYGALGVGSTDKLGGNPTMIRLLLSLRKWRLTQLMTNIYEKIAGSFRSGNSNAGKTRMEAMVGDQQIPYGSKLFDRGIDQFRSNMSATLDLFHKRNIPVFISDIVSNEKDLWPFISVPAGSAQLPEFKKDYEGGVKAFDSGDLAAAADQFGAANRVYNGHARCNFYLGRLAYGRRDFTQAKAFFSRARELDALRFRGPDTINTIIGQLCNQYENTHLVDTRAAFEAASEHSIIGDELILEHVHPDLNGYALMSDVFYEAMKKQGLFTISREKEMSFPRLLHEMPVTIVDSLAAVYRMFNLKRSWPFRQPAGKDELTASHDPAQGPGEGAKDRSRNTAVAGLGDTLPGLRDILLALHDTVTTGAREKELAYNLACKKESWEDVMAELYEYYIGNKDLVNAGKVMGGLALEHPAEEAYYEKAANVYGKGKDLENAAFYFRKAFTLAPGFDKARHLFVIYLQLDRPADAMPFLDWAIQNNASGMQLGPVRQLAVEVIQLQKGLARDSSNLSALNQIAVKYFEMGNKEGGIQYANKVLRIDPGNKETLSLLARFKK